jgi:hypothetical protein
LIDAVAWNLPWNWMERRHTKRAFSAPSLIKTKESMLTRLRNVLAATSMAAILSGSGLAVTARPANAATNISQCGSYAYYYNYWSDAAFNEWLQNGATSYFDYAVDRSFYYSDLFTSSNC